MRVAKDLKPSFPCLQAHVHIIMMENYDKIFIVCTVNLNDETHSNTKLYIFVICFEAHVQIFDLQTPYSYDDVIEGIK